MNDVAAAETSEDSIVDKAADFRPVTPSNTVVVSSGVVYELRLEVRDRSGAAGRLRFARIDLEFLDDHGRRLPQVVTGRDRAIPDTEPCRVEALPAAWDDELVVELAVASRFVVAPPDAVTLSAHPRERWARLVLFEAAPVGLVWRSQSARAVGELQRLGRLRATLVRRRCGLSRLRRSHRRALRELREAPVEQFRAIAEQFRRGAAWAPVLSKLEPGEAHAAYRERVAASRGARPKLGRVGFIGTERSYLRLLAWFDVVLLREDDWRNQLASLALDAVIIETCSVDFRGEWMLAFGGLEGRLGTSGRAVVDTAKDSGIAVSLWITAPASEAPHYEEMRRSVDRLIVEGGSCTAWTPPNSEPGVVRSVPRAAEPSLAAPIRTASLGGSVAPILSDLYHSANVRAQQATVAGPDMLHTEFTYSFKPRNLASAVSVPATSVVHCTSYLDRVQLLQHAKAVVLYRDTLRSVEELEDIVSDAVSAGALVLLVGPGVAPARIAELVIVVNDARALDETLRLADVDWWRERAWRTFHRRLMATRRWRRRDAAMLVPHHPAETDTDDEPLMSAVMISKRPHYVARCLETFRKQTWSNRELLLVLNTAAPLATPPPLRANERLLHCPEHRNIGCCLNLALAAANGRYWAKMDDDDFYSRFYLEDLANAYAATGADVVGRQSCYFHLAGRNTTVARPEVIERSRRFLVAGEYISGATLSGRRDRDLPSFSFVHRNSVDSEWVERVIASGFCLYSLDTTGMVVFRDADVNAHTWRTGPAVESTGIEDTGAADLFAIFERTHD